MKLKIISIFKKRLFTIGIVATLILIEIIYGVQLMSVTALQTDLQEKMRHEITEKIISEAPLENSSSTIRATTGTISNKTNEEKTAEFADTIASLVISQISNDYKDELKELVIDQLMSDIGDIVRQHYQEYTSREANDIAASVKIIVLEELQDYTKKLENEVYETKNLYTAVQNTLAGIKETQNSTQAKIAAIQNTYNNEIAKLKQKDNYLQAQIDTLSGKQVSNRNEFDVSVTKAREAFNEALKKLQNNTLSSDLDILRELETVRDALDNAESILNGQLSSLDSNIAANIQAEINARKQAINEAITSLRESDSIDKQYLISLLQTTNNSLTSKLNQTNSTLNERIGQTVANLAQTANDLSNADAANKQELTNELNRLNENIETLIQELRDTKLDKVAAPTYETNSLTNSVTVTVPDTYPNQN